MNKEAGYSLTRGGAPSSLASSDQLRRYMAYSTNSPCRQAARRLLRTKQAATYLGVSAWKLRQLAQDGELAYIAADEGSPWRFDLCDLDAYIERAKTTSALA